MPAPTATQRDGVLARLRRGPATVAELVEDVGLPCDRAAVVHLESLTWEPGLSIDRDSTLERAQDGGCAAAIPRFTLTLDEWSDQPGAEYPAVFAQGSDSTGAVA